MKYKIGHQIKRFREKAGITQAELAESISITGNAVSNWEQGLSRPSTDQLEILCRVLNVSSDVLLGIDKQEITDESSKGKLTPYHIGRQLRQTRKNRNLKQSEVAERVGVANSTYANWEQGSNRPNTDQLVSLCHVLNVSADVLLGIDDQDIGKQKTGEEYAATFAKNLKAEIKRVGMTIDDLGRLIGSSSTTVSDWITGNTQPHLSTLFQICEALNCDPSWLAGFPTKDNLPIVNSYIKAPAVIRQAVDGLLAPYEDVRE